MTPERVASLVIYHENCFETLFEWNVDTRLFVWIYWILNWINITFDIIITKIVIRKQIKKKKFSKKLFLKNNSYLLYNRGVSSSLKKWDKTIEGKFKVCH